jgi:uncharacterized protein (DUF58 family)
MRRLEIHLSGRWYLLLTIAIGVVAMVSGNNILYLIESLLLSGFVLSGVLSERTVWGIEAEIIRTRASAGTPTGDRIVVKNTRRVQLFCVEIGEWDGKKVLPVAFVPRIAGRSTIVISSSQILPRRGIHHWKGVAVSTSYPFGFVRKLRFMKSPGERIVWPAISTEHGWKARGTSSARGSRLANETSEGEIRPFTQDDDLRRVVWTMSSKGTGLFIRPQRPEQEDPEVFVDLRSRAGEEFERKVEQAAQPFHLLQSQGSHNAGSLIVVDHDGKKRYHGQVAALDELAQVEAREK